MKYAVVIGDARFACLGKLLAARGHDVYPMTAPAPQAREILGRMDGVVCGWPLRLSTGDLTYERMLEWTGPDCRICLCGPGTPEILPPGRQIVNLWADEALIAENARLTAEGAVAAAMSAAYMAVRDSRCLVIGWGRIGSALAEILVALGARVTVASGSEAGRHRAIERGAEAAVTGEAHAVRGKDIIFNTAPAMVLDEQLLRSADRTAMIIDLASPPYGVDLRAAWDMGIRAWREPGLPGRYCPESAARAILGAMIRASEKEGSGWKV